MADPRTIPPPQPRWGSLLDRIPAYVCVVDAADRFEWVNRVDPGLTLDQVLGQDVFAFTEPQYHDLMRERLRAARETGTTQSYEVEGYRSPDGRGKFEVDVIPLESPGSLLLVVNDVTEQRRDEAERDEARQALESHADALVRSNADLQQFAYVASHDLQTPLRTIGGFVDLLARRLDDRLDDKTRRYMGHIIRGVEDMQALIDGLVEYSRVETAPRDRWARVDLGQVVRSVASAIRAETEEAGAEILWDGLPTVFGDPVQLRQVLQNLLVNAVRHRHPDRAPRVTVEAMQDGPRWVLSVTDNGQGIHPGVKDHVFTIFRRGNTDAGGLGLGLAICKKVIERHGGSIWVETVHGERSCFQFTLPAEDV